MNRAMTLILCLTIAGCNSSTDKRTSYSTDTLSSQARVVKASDTISQSPFNANGFRQSADSILSDIFTKHIHSNLAMDTITPDKADEQSPFHALHPTNKTLIKRYALYPKEVGVRYMLWFIDASYSDTNNLKSAFAELQNQSGKVDEHDILPGLTYENSYVIKTNKKIYWLNSGCPYAYFNHQRLCNSFRQSIETEGIIDSICCECGKPKCKQ